MKPSKMGILVVGIYLILVGLSIAYELDIRNTGHSEFAGWMSTVLTLPSSYIVNVITRLGFGIRIGDSNTAFVMILTLAALVNAFLVYVIIYRVSRGNQSKVMCSV